MRLGLDAKISAYKSTTSSSMLSELHEGLQAVVNFPDHGYCAAWIVVIDALIAALLLIFQHISDQTQSWPV